MKTCNMCGKPKQDDEFKRRTSGGLVPYCTPCKRLYDRQYWAKTAKFRRKRKKYNGSAVRQRNQRYIYSYLDRHPCSKCGEADIAVLVFHHLRDKLYDITSMGSYAIKTIDTEIAKCIVLCANCHARLHYTRKICGTASSGAGPGS